MSRALEYLKPWRVPIGLAALLIVLQAAGLRDALEYSREAARNGQLWRLLTGNLVHLGWLHLCRDLAGLGLIWWLICRHLSERIAVGVLAVSALSVGVGLLLFSPRIEWYVGISGALFGLYTAGVLRICKERLLLGAALLAGMLGILAWSLYAGGLPGETTDLGGAVIPQAHFYGAIGGALTMVVLELFQRDDNDSLSASDGR
jgi:rhomboid family GlyGly-CTERM serine protease